MIESIPNRFALMDIEEPINHPYFSDNLDLKERSQANRRYNHSKQSHNKQLRPEYYIPNRFELMDFD